MRIEPSESKYVYVDSATLYGGYPNVSVFEGEVYSFKVNPLCRWKRKFFSYTAEGTRLPLTQKNKRRFKKAPYFSLCGTVNMAEENQFGIGLHLDKYEVPESGELNFFPNKAKGDKVKGSGYLIVEVLRIA